MNLLLICYPFEKAYARYLAAVLPHGVTVQQYSKRQSPNMPAVLKRYDKIITTRKDVLSYLEAGADSVYNYQGSLFKKKGSEVLILSSLRAIPYDTIYQLKLKQFICKLVRPEIYPPQQPLQYKFHKKYDEHSFNSALEDARNCLAMSVDVETRVMHNGIKLSGYACIMPDLSIRCHIVPIISEETWELMRAMNDTPCPKIMHNGTYDSTYFIRWSAPIRNWCFDTMHMFHSQFHDLPKTLADVTAMYVRESQYWKEGRKVTDEHEKVLYNARDVYYTALSFIGMLMTQPDWVVPQMYYKIRRSHYGTIEGIKGMKVSPELMKPMRDAKGKELDAVLQELRDSVGDQDYNPGSHQQNKRMLTILAQKRTKVNGSDADECEKVAKLDEFCYTYVTLLLKYKELSKIIGTYLDAVLTETNRLTWSIDVSGTTSDRWASRKANEYNKPSVGKSGKLILPKPKNTGQSIFVFKGEARKPVVPDEGMVLWSCDLPQSESRFTAYLSEDEGLIDAVENSGDFHCANASRFFGVPYEELFDDETRTKLNVDLRNLSKRVNHGANYNMGAYTLLNTMGIDNVLKAQKLLDLPRNWRPTKVCQHLLDGFESAYPLIKGSKTVSVDASWYGSLMREVMRSGKVTTPFGWTKQIFGNPVKNKMDMNNLASVKPQNMSAEYLHRAHCYLWETEYVEGQFEIIVPIHDEIVGQCKIGMEDHYSDIIVDAMTQEYEINGRKFTIKPDAPQFGYSWGDIH